MLLEISDGVVPVVESARDLAVLITKSLSPSVHINDVVSRANPLPSTRQHPSYGDCLEVKREYCQNSSVLDCVTQCSQSAAHLCEQFLQVQQIGFVTLGPLHCA